MASFLRSETASHVVSTAMMVSGVAAESVARFVSTAAVTIVLLTLRPAVFPVSASPLLSSVTSSINTSRPILVSPFSVQAPARKDEGKKEENLFIRTISGRLQKYNAHISRRL